MLKHWAWGRLHVFAGKADHFGIEISYGWFSGLVLQLAHLWIAFEWWPRD